MRTPERIRATAGSGAKPSLPGRQGRRRVLRPRQERARRRRAGLCPDRRREQACDRPLQRRARLPGPLRADEPAVPRDRPRASVVLRLRESRRARPGQRREQRPLRARGGRLREADEAVRPRADRDPRAADRRADARGALSGRADPLARPRRGGLRPADHARPLDARVARRAAQAAVANGVPAGALPDARAPNGHGYGPSDAPRGIGYYAFTPKPGLRFVVVDTVADSGDQGTSTERSSSGSTPSCRQPKRDARWSSSSRTTRS